MTRRSPSCPPSSADGRRCRCCYLPLLEIVQRRPSTALLLVASYNCVNSIMARRASKKPPSALLNKVKAAATGANGASAVNGNASTGRPAKEEDPAVKEQRERQQSLENRQLASKEAALFKQLLTLYETKQHKKGVKTAEQILKKYPNHGGEDVELGSRDPYSN